MADNSHNQHDVVKRNVRRDLCKGVGCAEIRDNLSTGVYGLTYTRKDAQELIAKIKREIKLEWEEEKKTLRELQMDRLQSLYADCLKNNQRSDALNTLKEMNKLFGAYEPDKVEMTVSANIEIDFGFEDTTNIDENIGEIE